MMTFTLNDVLEMLKRQVAAAGSQHAWAEAHGIVPSHISDVLNRRREPGPILLRALLGPNFRRQRGITSYYVETDEWTDFCRDKGLL